MRQYIVYHGSSLWDARPLLSGKIDARRRLYVTDTKSRARDYANARTSGDIHSGTPRLHSSAIIICFAVPYPVHFQRRPSGHSTLDKAEAVISLGSIREVWIGHPSRNSYQSIDDVKAWRKRLGNRRVHLVQPVKTIHNSHLADI